MVEEEEEKFYFCCFYGIGISKFLGVCKFVDLLVFRGVEVGIFGRVLSLGFRFCC